MATPGVFLVHHGETEWSLSGRHTGRTDIPLTDDGEKRVRATGRALVGDDRLIVPRKLVHMYITSADIRKLRQERGQHVPWDTWRDGCPGGESPDQVTARLDELIAKIRTQWHESAFRKDAGSAARFGDVLVVAHGYILRALAKRWAGETLPAGPAFLLEAGGVGTLSYEHDNIHEPAILLGGAFVVDTTLP